MQFRVELVWQDEGPDDVPSIYLTSDGRVVLQGRRVAPEERERLSLPTDADLISVDRRLIQAIKDML